MADAITHTDLMVSPESIDAFMEANPLPVDHETPTTTVRTIHQWRGMEPKTVIAGSTAQVLFCIRDAKAEILAMSAEIKRLQDHGTQQTAALTRARELIAEIRAEDFESFTVGGDPASMDEAEAGWIGEYDAVLAQIDGALNG